MKGKPGKAEGITAAAHKLARIIYRIYRKRLGVKGRALGQCYSGRGEWAMSRHPAVQQALKNRTLYQ